MGSVRSGDIRQFTWFGKEFDIKGEDSNVSLDIGGYTTESSISGNGTFLSTKRRKKAVLSDVVISLDDTRKDLEFLQEKINTASIGPLTITLASGVTYQGSMALTGELKKSTGDGTATVTFEGSTMEQI